MSELTISNSNYKTYKKKKNVSSCILREQTASSQNNTKMRKIIYEYIKIFTHVHTNTLTQTRFIVCI